MPPLSPRRFVVVLALALEAFPAAASAQAVPAPKVTSIVPRYLAVERDTQIEIHGTAFTRSMVITLEATGATGGTPLKFQYLNATLVRAVAPKRPRGLVDAVVRDGSLT